MKYTIMVTQTLYGYVEIEAPDDHEALKIAERRFCEKGEMLPDMEDFDRLLFDIVDEYE